MGQDADLRTVSRDARRQLVGVWDTFLMPSAACCSDTSFSGATTGMAGGVGGCYDEWPCDDAGHVRGESTSFRTGGPGRRQRASKMTKDAGRAQKLWCFAKRLAVTMGIFVRPRPRRGGRGREPLIRRR